MNIFFVHECVFFFKFFIKNVKHVEQIVRKRLELFEQRNAQGKIIILYDEDERMASQAATTMCERGFENLFMLSGGESLSCTHV